jgi:hypothetical protein
MHALEKPVVLYTRRVYFPFFSAHPISLTHLDDTTWSSSVTLLDLLYELLLTHEFDSYIYRPRNGDI